MKRIIFITAILTLLISCERSDNTCNCDDPMEDLLWLQELKSSFTNCYCQMSIIQATYEKKTVFYSAMTDALCDGYYPVVLRDCNGDIIKVYEPPFGEVFGNEVTDRKVIYNCKIEF